MLESILVGAAVTVVGGLALWLTRGRIERVEADIAKLDRDKASLAVCQVQHEAINRRLQELADGQTTIFAKLDGLANTLSSQGAMLAELKGRVK